MLKSLLRLRPFIEPYRVRMGFGFAAFGTARAFEIAVPFLLAIGIDRIAAGSTDLLLPVAGVFAAVCGRFLVVSLAGYLVRCTGIRGGYALRERRDHDLQYQGALMVTNSTGVKTRRSQSEKRICLVSSIAFRPLSRYWGKSPALTGPYLTRNPVAFFTSCAATPVAPSWGRIMVLWLTTLSN